MEATSDAHGIRDNEMQHIFLQEQQHAKKRNK